MVRIVYLFIFTLCRKAWMLVYSLLLSSLCIYLLVVLTGSLYGILQECNEANFSIITFCCTQQLTLRSLQGECIMKIYSKKRIKLVLMVVVAPQGAFPSPQKSYPPAFYNFTCVRIRQAHSQDQFGGRGAGPKKVNLMDPKSGLLEPQPLNPSTKTPFCG